MAGVHDPRPSFPDWILECYECLRDHLCEHAECPANEPKGIERTAAVEFLVATIKSDLEPDDAAYALERLLDRGYFYEVETELRLTTPDEQCSN